MRRGGQRLDYQRFRWRRALQLSGGSDPPVHQRSPGSDDPDGGQVRKLRKRNEALRERLRESLRSELPDCQFSFEPGDIVGQVMSFGSADAGRDGRSGN